MTDEQAEERAEGPPRYYSAAGMAALMGIPPAAMASSVRRHANMPRPAAVVNRVPDRTAEKYYLEDQAGEFRAWELDRAGYVPAEREPVSLVVRGMIARPWLGMSASALEHMVAYHGDFPAADALLFPGRNRKGEPDEAYLPGRRPELVAWRASRPGGRPGVSRAGRPEGMQVANPTQVPVIFPLVASTQATQVKPLGPAIEAAGGRLLVTRRDRKDDGLLVWAPGQDEADAASARMPDLEFRPSRDT